MAFPGRDAGSCVLALSGEEVSLHMASTSLLPVRHPACIRERKEGNIHE